MLEKSATFCPLMREFVILALIATRAGKHNITSIITWSKLRTGNRNSMVKMIDIRLILTLLKCAKAIIASVVLGFHLHLNLLHCQRAFKTSQTGTSPLFVDTPLSKVQGTLPLVRLSLPLRNFFTMSIAVMRCRSEFLFSMLLIVLQLLCALPSMILFPRALFLLIDFFSMSLKIVSLLYAYLFPMSFIVLPFLLVDLFSMSFTVVSLLHTNFFPMLLIALFAIFNMSIIVGVQRYVSALFAKRMQFVSILMEEIGGSGQHSLARASTSLLRGIVLGYTVHMVDLLCLSSFPRSVSSTRGGIIMLSLYHKSACRASLVG